MKNVRVSPAVQKGFDFIRNHLETGVWRPGDTLPPVRTLAAGAGVSFVPMIKAMARLKAKGFINGIPQGRFRAGGSGYPAVLAQGGQSSLRRLKRMELEKDILAGFYSHQEKLPSRKELQARYGVCYTTMRTILQSLASDDVVRLRGKSYYLRHLAARSGRQRIVFVTYGIRKAPWSALNQGQYRVLDLFEYECVRANLKLEVVHIDFYNSAEVRRAIAGPQLNAPVLGYVFDVWWYTSDEYRRLHIDFLTALASKKRPVAIIDELGDFMLPLAFTSNPLLQVFRIEGKRAGERMARLLMGMGHRSVAFISSQHHFSFSRQRYEGVLEQYDKAGFGSGVALVADENMDIPILHTLALSGLADQVVRKVIAVNVTARQAEDQYRALQRFKEAPPSTRFKPADVEAIQKSLAGLADLAGRDLERDYFEQMCIAALNVATRRVSALSVEPLLERALEQSGATAWICVSDGIALAALRYLGERHIPVPGELSIVGFDNVPVEAIEHHLTSFDFNAAGFVHRVLSFIARPPRPRGLYRHMPLEVEGLILQRGSTGPVRKKSLVHPESPG